jgi:6-phosphogluconolactonase
MGGILTRNRAESPRLSSSRTMASLSVHPDAEAAARAAADRVVATIERARGERGIAHIALAGGNTPRRSYELLVADGLDWSSVHLWFGDERCVPPDDPESNYRMVRESLLEPAGNPADQVHRMKGEIDAEEAVREYAAALPERLDLAFLGLGEDGHTASLFPGDPLLEDPAPVRAVHRSKPPPRGITLGVGVLRGARERVILAAGAGKKDAVAAVLRGPDPAYPSSLVDPDLIVDEAAAP